MNKNKKKPITSNNSNKKIKNNKTLTKPNSNGNVTTITAKTHTQLFGELSLQLQEKMRNELKTVEMNIEKEEGNDVEEQEEDDDDDSYPTSRIIKRDANGQIIVTEVNEEGNGDEEDPFLKFHNNNNNNNNNNDEFLPKKHVDITPEEYNEQLMTFRKLYDNVYKRCVDTSSKAEFLETFKDAVSTAEGEVVLSQLKSLLQIEDEKNDPSKDPNKILSGMMKLDNSHSMVMQRSVPSKDIFDMANSFYNKTQMDLINKNPDLKTAIADNLHRIINTNPKNVLNEVSIDISSSMKAYEDHPHSKNIENNSNNNNHNNNSSHQPKQSKKMSVSQLENLNNFFKELSLKERQKIMQITREDVFNAFSKFELKGHLDPFQVSGYQSLAKKNTNSFSTSDFLEECTCCNGEAHFDYEKAARKIYDALYRSEKMKDESLTDVEFNIQMCNEREYNYKQHQQQQQEEEEEGNTTGNGYNKIEYSSLPSYMASEEEAAAAPTATNNLQGNTNRSSQGSRVNSTDYRRAEMIERCISSISANPTNHKLLVTTMSLLPVETLDVLEDLTNEVPEKDEEEIITITETDVNDVIEDEALAGNPDLSALDFNMSSPVAAPGTTAATTAIVGNAGSNINTLNPERSSFSADSFYDSLRTSLMTEIPVDRQKQQYANLKKLSEIVWHNSSPDLADPVQFLKDQKQSLKKKEHEDIKMDLSTFEERLGDIKKFVETECSDTKEKDGDENNNIVLPDFKNLVESEEDGDDELIKKKDMGKRRWGALDKVISVDYDSFFRDLFKDDLACLIDIKPPNNEVGVHLKSISDDFNDSNGNIVSAVDDEKNYVGSIVKKNITEVEDGEEKDHQEGDEAVEEEEDEDDDDDDEDDDYNDSMFEDYEEKERIYNRCKSMIRFAVQFILKERLEHAAKEQVAEKSRLSLLKQLEEEEEKGSTSKSKKNAKKKEKNKKKQQQLQQQEAKMKEDELNKQQEELLKKEKEEKEIQRREEQRKKAEELKRKRDEQLRKKKEEQARRDEAEAKARRLKEEQKRLKEEERKQKQLAKEKEKKLKQEQKEKELKEKQLKEAKEEKEEEARKKKQQQQQEEEAEREKLAKQKFENVFNSTTSIADETTLESSQPTARRHSSLVPPQALQPYMYLLDSTQNNSDSVSNLLSLNNSSNASSQEPQSLLGGNIINSNTNTIPPPVTPLLASSSTYMSPSPVIQGMNNNMNYVNNTSTTNGSLFNTAYGQQMQNNNNIYQQQQQQQDTSSLLMNNVNSRNTSQLLSFMSKGMGNTINTDVVDSTVNTSTGSYGFNSLWNNNINTNNINPLSTSSSGTGLMNQTSAYNYQQQQQPIPNDMNNPNNTAASALNSYYSGLMQNYGSNVYTPMQQQPQLMNANDNSIISSVAITPVPSSSGAPLLKNNITNTVDYMLHQLIYSSYIDYIKRNPIEVQPISVIKLYNFIIEVYNKSLQYSNFIIQLEQMSIPDMTNKYKDVLFLSRDLQGNITNIWFDLSKKIYISDNITNQSNQTSIWG
ncbi:hypothetical protein HANVADRAFT_52711 [Hanseniaspora valbyensis NRRL Y-1626]|uniref:Stress response protein NST1 n=1 Tax=Hanseniaspora valbyensis NRRL Y-1626 TaxID=766949 RepID=A0A1B7TE36_9ASCO|nr:hypothetical protein HANVADRAFT_52711 [Hanseniaspora valbyensis NRRL Y-1626]